MDQPTGESEQTEECNPPKSVLDARRLPVTYLREKSSTWDRVRFREVLETEIDPDTLGEITHRRIALRNFAPWRLHEAYDGNAHSGHPPIAVTSDIVSISPAYGAVLYNLARSVNAKLILEDGAGFGISSMYLAAAAREEQGGILLSFEISNYSQLAQASVNLVDPGSRVVQDDFACFPSHLAGAAQVDFAFIDAMHEKDSMLRSFKSLSGWMSPQSIIVVDDLSYSESARDGFKAMMRMEQHNFVCIVNQRFGVLIRG